MDKYKDITNEDLAALAVKQREAFDALIALDEPTIDQVNEAEALGLELDEIAAETSERETEAAAAAEKFAALKGKFSNQPEEAPADGEVPDGQDPEDPAADPEADPAVDPEADPADQGSAQTTSASVRGRTVVKASTVRTIAAKTKRPAAPASAEAPKMSLTAAADVPGFAASSPLNGIEDLAAAVVSRTQGFAPPTGDGMSEDLRKFNVASIHLPFTPEMTIDRGSDDMEVLTAASKEARLDGGSLVAAGGWCAPSETMYDLCAGETLEGLVSVPEVNVKRGGINYTTGPNFADFYGTSNGMFVQTEAQAIAGTTKPCVTVTCPAFQEVRMDAIGLCIKIPILTESTYPELIQRYVSGFTTAFEHRKNANIIGRMLALTPAARVMTGLGSSVIDTLDALVLVADQRRQQRRLSMNQSFEIVVPFWVKNMLLSDLRARTMQTTPVTDAQLAAHFAAAKLSVQYVYDWQDLPLVDDTGTTGKNEANSYPATFNVLMYPAGTFVVGTKDVINLSAVYDAASLAVNVYTGLFMEQGLLVAKMCNDSDLLTIPVCNAGRTGAANLTCS